jgi:coiled-coil domain-containing protein 130
MQGFNKYYPPDYDCKKTLNQLAGTHALGKRARKSDQGILISRFELPFSIYCETCRKRLAQGVRYNAEKKKIGNYYTTPIWSFRMKCHLCVGWFEIHTDPKNTDYKIVSGARRTAESENERLERAEAAKPEIDDPIARLERDTVAKTARDQRNIHLAGIYDANARQWDDVYTQSQKLRHTFRHEKKQLKKKQDDIRRIQTKHSLGIPILDQRSDDIDVAAGVGFRGRSVEKAVRNLLRARHGPIFAGREKIPEQSRAVQVISGLVEQDSDRLVKSSSFTSLTKRQKVTSTSSPHLVEHESD